MKKLGLMVLGLCFCSGLVFAQANVTAVKPVAAAPVAAAPVKEEIVTLKGDIIDNACASAQKADKLAEFVKTHTKACALMAPCVLSGYSIYADGKLSKFDKVSNAKIEDFLKKKESKLQVVVKAKKIGDMLSLESIENQK